MCRPKCVISSRDDMSEYQYPSSVFECLPTLLSSYSTHCAFLCLASSSYGYETNELPRYHVHSSLSPRVSLLENRLNCARAHIRERDASGRLREGRGEIASTRALLVLKLVQVAIAGYIVGSWVVAGCDRIRKRADGYLSGGLRVQMRIMWGRSSSHQKRLPSARTYAV